MANITKERESGGERESRCPHGDVTGSRCCCFWCILENMQRIYKQTWGSKAAATVCVCMCINIDRVVLCVPLRVVWVMLVAQHGVCVFCAVAASLTHSNAQLGHACQASLGGCSCCCCWKSFPTQWDMQAQRTLTFSTVQASTNCPVCTGLPTSHTNTTLWASD